MIGPGAPELLHYYRGRVALYAILRALGVTTGDEVVLQAYTCEAVPEAVLRLGARPVYADVDRRTLAADPASVAGALSPRTVAVIVQHTFGTPADVGAIKKLTTLPIVEDCAHVTSGPAREQLGKLGVAAFFSYEWDAPVVAGPGGLAVVNDRPLAVRMRADYRNFVAPPPGREALLLGRYAANRLARRAGVTDRLRGAYRRLLDVPLADTQLADTQLADAQLTDAQLTDAQLAEAQLAGALASPEYHWRMSRTVHSRLPGRIRHAQGELTARQRLAWDLGVAHGPVPDRVPLAVADKSAVLRENAMLGEGFTTAVHPLSGDDLRAAGYTPGSCPNAEWAAEHVVTVPVRAGVDPAAARQLLNRLRTNAHA